MQQFVQYIYFSDPFDPPKIDIRPITDPDIKTIDIVPDAVGFRFFEAENSEVAPQALNKDLVTFFIGNKEQVIGIEQIQGSGSVEELLIPIMIETGCNRIMHHGFFMLNMRDQDMVIDQDSREIVCPALKPNN